MLFRLRSKIFLISVFNIIICIVLLSQRPLKGWEAVQYERRNLIKSNCKHYYKKPGFIPSLQKLTLYRKSLNHILVDDLHEMLYCYIPKVSCTEWKRIMFVLRGRASMEKAINMPHIDVHMHDFAMQLGNPAFKKKQILRRLKRYKKFIIVRHPLERLLSAFNNKFNSSSYDAPEFKEKYAIDMMVFARNTTNVPQDGEGLLFTEFLHYISTHNPVNQQEHWRPFVYLCHPCLIDYDFVAKFETLTNDSNHILESINAPPEVKFPKYMPSHTAHELQKLLPTIPKDILDKLYKLYEPDFKLFGYS